ncbi:hypothetical protein mRhiFer1_009385 [Rhinolophus ferrumequinum]|uniref:Uncharacterized protein n=1 Tax=Rhinolophus ferrumequinum TaxID=59479 RepID=A0A7J7RPQ4_RHIFE|nr:hypothetical protein mRhiFer1_009385 [Rhinolophus ferrumequinum]
MRQALGHAIRVGKSQGSTETSTASRAGEGAWWSQTWACLEVALGMRKTAASRSTAGNHSVIWDQRARWKPEASWELGQAVPGPGTGVALRSPGGHLASERGGHPSLPHPTGLGSQGRGAPAAASSTAPMSPGT